MPEHPLQGVGVAPCLLGKCGDVHGAGGDVVGDPQGCYHADAPGRAEIAQRAELGAGSWCLFTCHLIFLLIGFLMAPQRMPRPDLSLLGARLDLHSQAREASDQWYGSYGSAEQSDLSCKNLSSTRKGNMIVLLTALRQVRRWESVQQKPESRE